MERMLKAQALAVAKLPADEAQVTLQGTIERVIQALVDEQLVLAEGAGPGLNVDEDEVTRTIDRLRSEYPGLFQIVIDQEGREGYARKLRMHFLYQAAVRRIVEEEANEQTPGESPGEAALLARWLVRARARSQIRVLYRPDLAAYLPTPAFKPEPGGGIRAH